MPLVGVPWLGSVLACLVWGDSSVNYRLVKVLQRLSLPRHHGTPMMAHLQLSMSFMLLLALVLF